MTSQPSERVEKAEAFFSAGQIAFERGNYRDAVVAFEEGAQLAGRGTLLGGSIQLWLMNAYSAAGRSQDAFTLGEKLSKHPDADVRKQSKRVLEILQAPRLHRRADWLTPVPDLSELDENETADFIRSKYVPSKKPRSPASAPSPPEDLTRINTRENGFLWVAIALVVLTLGGLFYFS